MVACRSGWLAHRGTRTTLERQNARGGEDEEDGEGEAAGVRGEQVHRDDPEDGPGETAWDQVARGRDVRRSHPAVLVGAEARGWGGS